jgi:recombinational DNA repair ATPase RecF
MEIKSRYEVIAGLEKQKRDLIEERDSLDKVLKEKEKDLIITERNKSDQIMAWDRKIVDMKEEVENFRTSMAQRKETIKELITSVDDSLVRFSKLSEK